MMKILIANDSRLHTSLEARTYSRQGPARVDPKSARTYSVRNMDLDYFGEE
jgi:hypothetical protein